MADRQLFDRPDANHRFHDLLLVAALASGDLDGSDADRARGLVDGCPECASLAGDLRAIAAETSRLATDPGPSRPRDFRIRPADAERLRPHGFRRIRSALDARRLELARPLATGLTMLGLVGLLLTSLPSFSLGGSTGGAPAARSQPAQEDAASAAPAPSDRDAFLVQGGDQHAASAAPANGEDETSSSEVQSNADGGPSDTDPEGLPVSPLRLASLAVLAAGLGLLVLPRMLRRTRTTR